MNISWLLGWRYLLGARSEKNISLMIIICFCGIFIGTLALALVASVMNGFEKVTHQKLQGIHSQIIMRSYGKELNASAIENVLKTVPAVQAYSPTAYKQVIIQNPDSDDITNAVLLKGIDPALENSTSSIASKIKQYLGDAATLPALIKDNHIAIGAKLAENLHIKPGDRIDLLYIHQDKIKNRKITLDKQSAIVSALFSTGIEEFDSGLVLASIDFLKQMYPDAGITQFNIQLAPGSNESETIAQLRNTFKLDVFSWKDLYPALVSALKLEKYAMFFILALIALVASMSIVSLIFMQILQKRPDIAILKSMGMASGTIITLFMIMGVGLAACAAAAGLITAYLIGLLIEHYPFITLPDTYYVSHLPIAMEWNIFLAIFLLVILMALIATWIPARAIKTMKPAQVLRFEG
jgi:lipoprotein-releasing system permease protein